MSDRLSRQKNRRVAMELEEITKEKQSEKEDDGAKEPMLGVQTEEEAEPNPYSKLYKPAEDVYAEAYFGDPPVKTKPGKQTEGTARLYCTACFFLTLLCLVLLLVVIVLSVKLKTGSTACPNREGADSPPFAPTYEQCQANFPEIQHRSLGCQQCTEGWLTFGRWCFYLSTFRLNWDQSQMDCIRRGGSLAVISSPGVQRFLAKEGNLKYWIGLRVQRNQWNWVNNTALKQSYWAENALRGECGILSGGSPPEKNWVRAPCHTYTYYICELEM